MYTFTYIMNKYCDYVIKIHQYIKKQISEENLQDFLLSLSRHDAFNYLINLESPKTQMYCTRHERYLLYKHLKGKTSPFVLYSYGKEKCDTRKNIIIKRKK